MGKRKSSKKPQGPKKRQALDTTFTCLFCHHENSVTCKMDKKESVGHLRCSICGQSYQCSIHHLSEPIDVYSEWIDAAEEAQDNTGGGPRRRLAAVASDDEQ